LDCAAEVRDQLMALSKGRIAESRMVERARIILACLDGKEMQRVAKEFWVSVVTVSKWRSRFALFGVRGLQDNLRPGKPPQYGTEFRDRVLKLLEQPPPEGYSHGEGPLVAEQLGASVHAVWRVLRREGIYPTEAPELVCEHRPAVRGQSRGSGGCLSESTAPCDGAQRG
jgi:transposase